MALAVVVDGWSALGDRPFLVGMGIVLGCIRVITGNLWACVGYHLVFQVVAQLLLSDRWDYLTVTGEETLTTVAFGGAFLLSVLITAMLTPQEAEWQRPQPDGTAA